MDGHRDPPFRRLRLDADVGEAPGREEMADRGSRRLLGQRLARLDRDEPRDFVVVDRTIGGVRERDDRPPVERRRLGRLLAGRVARAAEEQDEQKGSNGARRYGVLPLSSRMTPQNRCRRRTLIE